MRTPAGHSLGQEDELASGAGLEVVEGLRGIFQRVAALHGHRGAAGGQVLGQAGEHCGGCGELHSRRICGRWVGGVKVCCLDSGFGRG